MARITAPGQFVYPTGMCATGDRLVVCDPGQPEVSGPGAVLWPCAAVRFDVSIHFTASRLPADPIARKRVIDQVVGNISAIVTEQKPAHTRAEPDHVDPLKTLAAGQGAPMTAQPTTRRSDMGVCDEQVQPPPGWPS